MLSNEMIDKLTLLMTSAFGLVAALAWNEAIKSLIENFDLTKYGPWIYAVAVTILAVVVTVYLGKVAEEVKKVDERLVEQEKKVFKKLFKEVDKKLVEQEKKVFEKLKGSRGRFLKNIKKRLIK